MSSPRQSKKRSWQASSIQQDKKLKIAQTTNIFHVAKESQRLDNLKTSPTLTKPAQIIGFSLGPNREFIPDKSQLRFYSPILNISPKTPLDIQNGFNRFQKRKDNQPEYLRHLLLHLMSQNELPWTLSDDKKAHFITWRGIMRRIMCLPYDKENFTLIATRYKGTIYIADGQAQLASQTPPGEKQQLFMYAGYKFEQLMTSSTSPDNGSPISIEKRQEETVSNFSEYGIAFKTKLGKHKIILGAELDCTKATNAEAVHDSNDFVEIKTHREMENQRHRATFARFKLFKTWAQCTLAGIPTILFGFRNESFQITSIKEYSTADIPRHARSLGAKWDPALCFKLAHSFLEFLQNNLEETDKDVVYEIFYDGKQSTVSLKKAADGKEQFLDEFIEDGTLV